MLMIWEKESWGLKDMLFMVKVENTVHAFTNTKKLS